MSLKTKRKNKTNKKHKNNKTNKTNKTNKKHTKTKKNYKNVVGIFDRDQTILDSNQNNIRLDIQEVSVVPGMREFLNKKNI